MEDIIVHTKQTAKPVKQATPGEWKLRNDKFGLFIEDAQGYPIASVSKRPDYKANAKLIIAAAGLLQALLDAPEAKDWTPEDYAAWCVLVRKPAIKKATP